MTPPHANGRPDRRDSGFALLVLLGVVGVGALGILLAAERFLPPLADRARQAEAHLATTAAAARAAFAGSGAFPVGLGALAGAGGLAADGAWRVDPFGAAQDLDYRTTASGVRVRSRGPDGRLGTADDIALDVRGEDLLRVRQRARLRLLRAAFLRSPLRNAATMSASDVAAMQAATRAIARARRAWLAASPAERVLLAAAMTAAQATIAGLRLLHGLSPMPVALTGAGGLMERIGRPDGHAVDGAGRPLVLDPALGVVAPGWDRIGGTDDDM